MIKERRKHARLRIPIEAEYQVAGEDVWRQGTIWSLGAGGAALLCEEKLGKGTILESLHFVVEAEGDLPETRIEVGAEVVNVGREAEFGCRSCFVLGLRFESLAEQDLKLLRQFVFRRLTAVQSSSADAVDKAGAPPIEVRFKLFDKFVEEVSENLSLSGMFIRAHRPLRPGSKFAFQFQLGEDFSLLRGTAEVVWTRRRSEGPERPSGMGVRFLKLDLTSQKMVRRLVDQREAQRDGAAGPAAPTSDDSAGNDVFDLAVPVERPAEPPAEDDSVAEPEAPAVAEAQPPTTEVVAESGSQEDSVETAGTDEAPSAEVRPEEPPTAAETTLAEAGERLTRLAVEADALREELHAERAACAAAEEARERAESTAAELRAELDDAARRAREEVARHQAEWGALETELRERLDRSEARREELEPLAERAEEAESDLEQLQQESAEARRESEALEAELRAQLERQGAERADLEDRVALAEDAATELRQRVAELEEQMAKNAKVEAALREQARELRAAPAELEARLHRATEQLRGLRGAAAEMTSDDLDAARELDGELERRLAEVAAAGSSLEEKIGGLIAARAGLTDRLTRIAGSWSELERGLAEADGEDLDLDVAPPEEQQGAEVEADPADSTEPSESPAPEPDRAAQDAPGPEPELEPGTVEPAPLEPVSTLSTESDEAALGQPTPTTDTAVSEDPEGEPEAADWPEPSAAARLVGAARRAAARLGLSRGASAGGNGSEPEPAASDPAPVAAGQQSEGEADEVASADGNGADAIEEMVRAWAAAWAEQRVEDYLSFYSREFEPDLPATDGGDGETPQAWLPPLAGMELTLGPISHTELSPGRFAVQFEQRVASDSYARRTGRTLELVRESDAWKIAAESFQEL